MLESKKRAIILLSLSFILAILAGVVFLQKVKSINSSLGEIAEVYIASTNIYSRKLIQPDQVTTFKLPKRYLNSSFITAKTDLINKVSVVPLSKGEIITKNVLKSASFVKKENHRLVTLFSGDKIFFDQELEPLDRVDIFVSHSFNETPKTELFLKDILVAMVAKTDDKFNGVALEVSLEEARELIHMQNYATNLRILKANVGKEKEIDKNEDQIQTAGEEE